MFIIPILNKSVDLARLVAMVHYSTGENDKVNRNQDVAVSVPLVNDTCIENGVPRSTTLNRSRLLCPVVTVLPRAPSLGKHLSG